MDRNYIASELVEAAREVTAVSLSREEKDWGKTVERHLKREGLEELKFDSLDGFYRNRVTGGLYIGATYIDEDFIGGINIEFIPKTNLMHIDISFESHSDGALYDLLVDKNYRGVGEEDLKTVLKIITKALDDAERGASEIRSEYRVKREEEEAEYAESLKWDDDRDNRREL
jgi:hypothetical protein